MFNKMIRGIGLLIGIIMMSAILAVLLTGLELLIAYIFFSDEIMFQEPYFKIIAAIAFAISFLKIFFGFLFEWISEGVSDWLSGVTDSGVRI